MKSLPPVSPTILGYPAYFGRFSPIVRQRLWKTAVEPVKWIPARCRSANRALLTSIESPGRKLITPGGSPASSSSRKKCQLLSVAVAEGFQTTAFPISAGAVGRLPPIAVKLNGVMA